MKLHCHIKPNVKHDEGVEYIDDIYVVRVKAPATEGKANTAAAQLLAGHFGVAPSHVRLISGHTSKYKTFEII